MVEAVVDLGWFAAELVVHVSKVTFFSGEQLSLEMHEVRIIQKLNLPPIEQRRHAMIEAGFSTFLLQNADVFLDMLTDSGVNAMSDRQQAAMLIADDAYAGSATFSRLASSSPRSSAPSTSCPPTRGARPSTSSRRRS